MSNVDLARLLETPHLATIVPELAPETLHALIRHRGLDASAELVAAATPEQLIAVLDIDLWRPARTGVHDLFDEDRFGEWVEALLETGDSAAARIVASIDANLVIAGLARYIRVFDVATLEPAGEDWDPLQVEGCGGLTREMGGYLVLARRSDAWDAIVGLLAALGEWRGDYFDAVMQGCRSLSNSAPEVDGLDELLPKPEQQLHDVADERDDRRSQQGYETVADARAFLQMARQPRRGRMAKPSSIGTRTPLDSALAHPSRLTPIGPLLAHLRDVDLAAFDMRTRELAFLANTLMAGCSVQSRPFTPQEASDAAVSVCNLGLQLWAAPGPESDTPPDAVLVDRDLVTAFEEGWSALHEQVSMFVAEHLIALLGDVRCADADIQEGLHALRRELVKQCGAGTPWRTGDALEVIGMLDLPVWASLRGLLDECPVLPAAVAATVHGRTARVSATAFEFIATTSQIREVHAFAGQLVDLLLR